MSWEIIFYILIFPGLVFTLVLGLLTGWIDRKISARFQFRVGPPLFQNFNDIFKLFGKEDIIPDKSVKSIFLLTPIISLAILIFISMSLGIALFYGLGFAADIIVIMYLLMIYSVMLVLGGSSSGNVYSSLGAGREIKLLLADELTFIAVCLIPIIKSGYNLQLTELINAQVSNGAFVTSISGVIGFLLGIISIQAKMTLQPFDIPEAETEIVDGPLMEYSGALLGYWELSHYSMWVVYPFLLILLYLGGFEATITGIIYFILKYLLIVVIMIIIKNTNPRLQIDNALKFFWKIAAPIGLLGIILSVLGV